MANDECYTPSRYIRLARQVMGGIDLDPASCEAANDVVKAARYYSQAQDGLQQPWPGRIFLNPPYSRGSVILWVRRLFEEIDRGRCTEAVVLVNQILDTKAGQALMKRCDAACFPGHRIAFNGAADGKKGNDHNQAFFYFGPNTLEFLRIFGEIGVTCVPSRMAQLGLFADEPIHR